MPGRPQEIMTSTLLRAFHQREVAINRMMISGVATFYSLRFWHILNGNIFQVGLNMGKLSRVSRGGSI